LAVAKHQPARANLSASKRWRFFCVFARTRAERRLWRIVQLPAPAGALLRHQLSTRVDHWRKLASLTAVKPILRNIDQMLDIAK
jgi:hypothetical protein